MAGDMVDFWGKRTNLDNKPTVENRTIRVIQHVMVKENMRLGNAIEELIKTPGLYDKCLDELKDDYPDIVGESV